MALKKVHEKALTQNIYLSHLFYVSIKYITSLHEHIHKMTTEKTEQMLIDYNIYIE